MCPLPIYVFALTGFQSQEVAITASRGDNLLDLDEIEGKLI